MIWRFQLSLEELIEQQEGYLPHLITAKLTDCNFYLLNPGWLVSLSSEDQTFDEVELLEKHLPKLEKRRHTLPSTFLEEEPLTVSEAFACLSLWVEQTWRKHLYDATWFPEDLSLFKKLFIQGNVLEGCTDFCLKLAREEEDKLTYHSIQSACKLTPNDSINSLQNDLLRKLLDSYHDRLYSFGDNDNYPPLRNLDSVENMSVTFRDERVWNI